jgi:HEAT repeat protein
MAEIQKKGMSKRKLDDHVRALRNGDSSEKEKAIEAMIDSPSKKIIEQIVPLLQEKDTATRMAVLEIMKKIGDYDLDAVTALLDDDNEDIRVYACEMLASIKHPDSIPKLIDKMTGDAANVRNAAASALGEFKDERAINALLNALHDDDWIAFSSIYSLGKIRNKKAVVPLLSLLAHGEEEISLAACEVLITFDGENLLEEIFRILRRWDKRRRDRYIEIIIGKGDEPTLERLRDSLGEELFEYLLNYVEGGNSDTRMMRMIATFKTPKTCEVLLERLKCVEPDEEEYGDLLRLFSGLDEVWHGRVQEYINRGDGYVLPVVQACEMAMTKISENILLEAFHLSEEKVKREIVRSIPVVCGGNGRAILREAVKDFDGHVRANAMTAIGAMSLMELKDVVIDRAKHDFLDVRIEALRTLIRLDRDEALRLIDQFVDCGSSEDKKVYLAVANLLNGDRNYPLVEKLFKDDDAAVRKSVTTVIGKNTLDKRYVDMIGKLLSGESIPHEVLQVIKDKRLVEFKDRLIAVFNDYDRGLWTRYYALMALGAFEDPSLFDFFVEGLEDENSLIKIASLKALADLKNREAVPHVTPYVDSVNDDVRATARFVLGKLAEY